MEDARKSAKKEKERLKKAAQSERKQLRASTSFCDSLTENEVPQLCASLSLGQLVNLNRIIRECSEDQDAIRTAIITAAKDGVAADEEAEKNILSSPKPKGSENGKSPLLACFLYQLRTRCCYWCCIYPKQGGKECAKAMQSSGFIAQAKSKKMHRVQKAKTLWPIVPTKRHETHGLQKNLQS